MLCGFSAQPALDTQRTTGNIQFNAHHIAEYVAQLSICDIVLLRKGRLALSWSEQYSTETYEGGSFFYRSTFSIMNIYIEIVETRYTRKSFVWPERFV